MVMSYLKVLLKNSFGETDGRARKTSVSDQVHSVYMSREVSLH
jgi:hypothetical protein